MRFTTISLMAFGAAALMAGPAFAGDCNAKADLEAAFTKQVTGKGWRHEIKSVDAEGNAQEEVYEFINPDRMYRKVTTHGQTTETIGIGRWAWTSIGGGYSEMQPQFAQMVTQRREQAFVKPQVTTEFKCLGTVTYAGKPAIGYQTTPTPQSDGTSLARTVYIDPASGLPIFNVLSAPDKTDKPVRTEVYSYPEKLEIEKPL